MAVQTVEAVVQAGAVETPYVRAGAGKALILLRDSETPLDDDPLFRRLAMEFRVIAPTVTSSSGASSFEDWLQGLIDGLGLQQPWVVLAATSDQELQGMLARIRA